MPSFFAIVFANQCVVDEKRDVIIAADMKPCLGLSFDLYMRECIDRTVIHVGEMESKPATTVDGHRFIAGSPPGPCPARLRRPAAFTAHARQRGPGAACAGRGGLGFGRTGGGGGGGGGG